MHYSRLLNSSVRLNGSTIRLLLKSSALLCGLIAASFGNAQRYPLSENLWSSQEFKDRVMGSYGVHTQLEPKLSEEESELFRTLTVILDSDLDQGAKMLQDSITPESSAALDFTLGTIRIQQNNPALAIESYKAAIKKFPNFMRAYKNLGLAYIQNEQLEEAATMLVKGIELGGGDGLSYGLLGYSYLNSGMVSSALNAYNLAIALSPRETDWKLGKIRCLVDLENFDEAAGLVAEMISEKPENHELYLHQANIALARERPLEAMTNLEIVRRMKKGNADSLFLLADIYANKGMFPLAISAYDQAMGASGKKEDFNKTRRAMQAFIEFQAWDEARELSKLITKRIGGVLEKEQRLELLNLNAELELSLDNSEAAAETLEKIIEEDPMNGRALLLLARFSWQRKDYEEAEFLYERAANIEKVKAQALLQHGQMKVERREYAEAANLIRESLNLDYSPQVADYLRDVEEASRMVF